MDPAESRAPVSGWRGRPQHPWPRQGPAFPEGLSGAPEMLPGSGPGRDGAFAQLSTTAGWQHPRGRAGPCTPDPSGCGLSALRFPEVQGVSVATVLGQQHGLRLAGATGH